MLPVSGTLVLCDDETAGAGSPTSALPHLNLGLKESSAPPRINESS